MLSLLARASLIAFCFSCSSITLLCLFDSAMANQPATISPNDENTASTISDPVQSAKNPSIATAEASNNRIFTWYMWFLVAAAIGTMFFTVAVFKASNKVQDAIKADADARIEALRTEGDKARLELAKTNVRLTETEGKVAEANRKAEEARRDTSLASKEAALANERAGKLELDAVTQRQLTAQANARAAEAQLALERFRTPRALTPEQRKTFVEEMSRFKGQRVFVGTFSNAFEVVAFGKQLFDALKEAGVKVEANPGLVTRVIGAAKGVVSRYTTGNDRSKAFAVALSEALNKKGFAAGAIDNLDEELVPKMEKEYGEVYARNGEHFSHVAVAIGDKP